MVVYRGLLAVSLGRPASARIDDTTVASQLLAWVRLSTQSALRVSWLGVNAAQIDQRTTYSSIVIGVSVRDSA